MINSLTWDGSLLKRVSCNWPQDFRDIISHLCHNIFHMFVAKKIKKMKNIQTYGVDEMPPKLLKNRR